MSVCNFVVTENKTADVQYQFTKLKKSYAFLNNFSKQKMQNEQIWPTCISARSASQRAICSAPNPTLQSTDLASVA